MPVQKFESPPFYLPAIASYAKHVSCMPYLALACGKGDLGGFYNQSIICSLRNSW